MKKIAMMGLVGATCALCLSAAAPALPTSAAPTAPAVTEAPAETVTNTTNVPITGRLADGTGQVAGTFVIDRFVEQDGAIAAVGTFTGSVTDATGAVREGSQELTVPVTATTSTAGTSAAGVTEAAADCPILRTRTSVGGHSGSRRSPTAASC